MTMIHDGRDGPLCRKCTSDFLLIAEGPDGAIVVRCPYCEVTYRVYVCPSPGKAKCNITVQDEEG